MAGYWPRSFLRVYVRLGSSTRKKEPVQYPAILTEEAWSIARISLYSKWTLTPLFIHHLLSSYLSITITIVKRVILFHKNTT